MTDYLDLDAMRERAKDDPRFEPYTRRDGWAQSTDVHPDIESGRGWICPHCGRNVSVFYGRGPAFNPAKRRYERPDNRACLDCWKASA